MTNEPPSEDAAEKRVRTSRLVRKTLAGVLLLGALFQVVLICYYLGAAHSPRPHHLPVGFVASDAEAATIRAEIGTGGSFEGYRYADAAALQAAIQRKKAYGGVDVTAGQPALYVASAAGPTAATAIRTAFTEVVEQLRTAQVKKLAQAGTEVPIATVQQLTTPPAITDLVPLPDADRGGSSLGLLVQVLAIGATIASTGLGRLGKHTTRSPRRGVMHALVLVLYALVSAAAVSIGAHLFGVIPAGEFFPLFGSFVLLSLALSCSVAAAVALVGPGGAILGTLYFLVGVVVSGASILPEYLPAWARNLGQGLPPGAGASLIRERLYFPAASTVRPGTVLLAYTLIGLAVVLITNTRPSSADSVLADELHHPVPDPVIRQRTGA